MPDMYRSPAIETYVDHGVVQGREQESLTMRQSARLPDPYAVPFSFDPSKARYQFPFPYEAPDRDPSAYERAGAELKNPIPYSDEVVLAGKTLYTKYCVSCHGISGQGDGKVVEWGNFPSPGAYNKKYTHLKAGHIFYSITYGKGLMGPHAPVLTKEERWKLVHYVQTLINQ